MTGIGSLDSHMDSSGLRFSRGFWEVREVAVSILSLCSQRARTKEDLTPIAMLERV